MTAPSIHDTLAELNELSQFFIVAERDIKDGRPVDMTGADLRISHLCKTVQDSIPEQQKIYLPELTALLNLLDSCEMALRSMMPSNDLTPQEGKDSGHAGS